MRRAIGSGSRGGKVKLPSRRVAGARALYLADDPIGSLDSTAKVALLEKVEQLARAKDPRVVQVMAEPGQRVRRGADRPARWHLGRRRAAAGSPVRSR